VAKQMAMHAERFPVDVAQFESVHDEADQAVDGQGVNHEVIPLQQVSLGFEVVHFGMRTSRRDAGDRSAVPRSQAVTGLLEQRRGSRNVEEVPLTIMTSPLR
jgi:hypothetical protein